MSSYSQLSTTITSATRGGARADIEKKEKKPNLLADLAMSVPRGVEGAVQGVYNLADTVAFDALPDYDKRVLGRSQTAVGGLAEGIVNFATGFIPIAGQIGKIGQVSRYAKAGMKNPKIALAGKQRKIASDITSGMITDFTVFDGQEDRLSDLVQGTPLANPVNEFLSNKDEDGQIEGRLKNVLEGLLIEGGVRGLAGSFMTGVKYIKKGKEAKENNDAEGLAKIFDEFLAESDKFSMIDKDIQTGVAFNKWLRNDFQTQIDKGIEENQIDLHSIIGRYLNSEEGKSSLYAPMFRHLYENAEMSLKTTQFNGFRDLKGKAGATFFPDTRSVTVAERRGAEKLVEDTQTEKYFLHEAMHAVTAKKIDDTFGLNTVDIVTTKDLKEKGVNYAQYLKSLSKIADGLEDSNPLKGLANSYLDAVLEGRSRKFLDSPDQLIESIKMRRLAGQDTYGLSSLHEFVAESWSNTGFLRKLYGSRQQSRSVYQKIVGYIQQLLGIPQNYNTDFKSILSDIHATMKDQDVEMTTYSRSSQRVNSELNSILRGGDNVDEYFGEGFQTLKAEDMQKLVDVREQITKDTEIERAVKGIDEEAVRTDTLPQRFEDDDIDELARKEEENLPKMTPEQYQDYLEGKLEAPKQPVAQVKRTAVTERNLEPVAEQFVEKAKKGIATLSKQSVAKVKTSIRSLKKEAPKRFEEIKKILDSDLPAPYMRRVLLEYGRRHPKQLKQQMLILDTEFNIKLNKLIDDKLSMQRDPTSSKNRRKLGKEIGVDVEEVDLQRDTSLDTRVFEDTSGLDPYRGASTSERLAREAQFERQLIEDFGSVEDGFQIYDIAQAQGINIGDAEFKYARSTMDAESKAYHREHLGLNDGEYDNIFGEGGTFTEQANKVAKEKFGGDNVRATNETLNKMLGYVSSSSGMAIVMRQLVDHIKDTTPPKPTTLEELSSTNEELIDAFGGDRGQYETLMTQLKGNADAMENFRAEQTAIKMTMDTLAIRLQKTAIYQSQNMSKVTDGDRVAFLEDLDRLYEVGKMWQLYGREVALSLVQRRGLLQGKGQLREVHKKIIDGNSNNRDVGTRNKSEEGQARYLNQKSSQKKYIDLVQEVADATNVDHLADGKIKEQIKVGAMSKLAKGIHGSRMLDMTLEYWTNSLLFGPTTQIVNLLGNSLTFAVRASEMVAGSALTGNMPMLRASVGAILSFDMYRDALKVASRTFKEGAQLTQGSRAFDDNYLEVPKISASNVNAMLEKTPIHIAEAGTLTSSIINGFGKYARLPGKALGAGDELFKQLNYRYYAKMKLAMEGIQAGKSGEALGRHVKEGLDGILDKGRAYNQENVDMNYYNTEIAPKVESGEMTPLEAEREYQTYISNRGGAKSGRVADDYDSYKVDPDSDRSKLAEEALEFAKQNTFTSDLDETSVLGRLSQSINQLKADPVTKPLGFIIPFVRTPTNILKFALDRTVISRDIRSAGMDGARLIGRFMGIQSDMKSALTAKNIDPVARANAYGKLTTSVGLVGTGIWYASQATTMGVITGAGPRDTDRKRALQQAGWQPYSIKVGDKYYSYNKLDPFSTVLGLYVDMAEAQYYSDIDDQDFEYGMGIVALSFVNNVANKSFLQGVDNVMALLENPMTGTTKLVGDIGAGFIPGYVPQLGNINQFREIKDARTVMDRILKRIPGTDSLMPKRNVLGEKVLLENLPMGGSLVFPSYTRTASDNVLDQEIGRLNKGFSLPKSKLMNTFDLRQYRNEKEQTAYDRLQELTGSVKMDGRTLRQELERVVKSRDYRSMEAGNDQELNLGIQPPRVKRMQKVINRYRKFAKSELLKEFPELAKEIDELLTRRNQII